MTLQERDEAYEAQRQEEVRVYHICCDLAEAFCKWINENTPYKAEITYYVGFMDYIGVTDRHAISIDIKALPFRNNSITFINALFQTERPIGFSIWKYDLSAPVKHEGHYDSTTWYRSLMPCDFPALWRLVMKFFDIEPKPVQLSLFDFMGE